MDRDQAPNDAVDENEVDDADVQDILLTDDDAPEESHQERVDWKAKAIELETRMRIQEERERQQQTQAQQPQAVDEIAAIEAEIAELESKLPPARDENSFWQRIELQEQIQKKTRELSSAVHRANQNRFTEMNSGSVVQQFKARYAADPTFKPIEAQFDQWVQQMEPGLRSNPAMLEMLRKNLAFDYLTKNGGRMPNQKPKAAPAAPSGAFAPEQQRQQAQAKQGAKFRSEAEAKVAEFYGMSADEYYDPRNNEVGPDTEGNGIQIMDLPAGNRRARRG